jgi:hypothetical protein
MVCLSGILAAILLFRRLSVINRSAKRKEWI